MQYRQVVYPKELILTRTTRETESILSQGIGEQLLNRTSLFADNGFGFRVISQSLGS